MYMYFIPFSYHKLKLGLPSKIIGMFAYLMRNQQHRHRIGKLLQFSVNQDQFNLVSVRRSLLGARGKRILIG